MKNSQIETKSLSQIKEMIETNIGKNIIISEYNKQGKKIKEYHAEIVEAYNSLFLVKIKINKSKLNRTFSYVDFVTNELFLEIV